MPMNINGDFETVDFVENRHIIVYDNIQNDEYPVHWHNSIEIIMPLAEKYIVSCSGEKYILNEREILIIPAGTLHQIDAQNGRRIFLIMVIIQFPVIRFKLYFSIYAVTDTSFS